jgi:hypothetical protein
VCKGGNITIKKKIFPQGHIFRDFRDIDVFLNGIIYFFFYILVEHKKANSVIYNNAPFRSSNFILFYN